MKTSFAIEYSSAPHGVITVIPAGTPVIPADNLPDGGYWVMPWNNMTNRAESWARNYGFHVRADDTEE